MRRAANMTGDCGERSLPFLLKWSGRTGLKSGPWLLSSDENCLPVPAALQDGPLASPLLQSCIESHSCPLAAAAALQSGSTGPPCAVVSTPECSGCLLQVTVMRDGATQQISVYDLLVGDVMLVETGDILAADGVLFKGNDVRQVQSAPVICTKFLLCYPLKLEHSANAEATSCHRCCLSGGYHASVWQTAAADYAAAG